jgi:hypothetical protein
MESHMNPVELGTLICKYCGKIIGTLNTEKVITYFVDCMQGECKSNRHLTEENQHVC